MAGTNKQSANELFGKISAYSTIVQQELWRFLSNFTSPYVKEYESTLDLIIDILRTLRYSDSRIIREILEVVTGDASITLALDSGYHGALNSLESKLALIESKQNNDSFITKLENAVKVTISSILTSFLSCSVSPFIPKYSLDTYYKKNPSSYLARPINIPTHILDFSNTLHVSPVGASGIYFYNTPCITTYYRRDGGTIEPGTATVADVRESNAEMYMVYNYSKIEDINQISDDDKKKFKKVISAPSSVKVKQDEKPPAEFVYTLRPYYTAESLYKTDDMNAFIWYVANRGDNTDDMGLMGVDSFYEYNKMMWDSRRLNSRNEDTARKDDDWDDWLHSKTTFDGKLEISKGGEDPVRSLYPILQLEPSENYGHLEHLLATFPAQTYLVHKKLAGKEFDITRTIYKFNSDYLRNIKIFNWKTIIMNLLYELNGITPAIDISFHLSLSDEIIDARLSTLILNTIMADDMEVDDSYYSFSNEDYSAALKRMELRKYGAKPYVTAAGAAIQNSPEAPLNAINSLSTAATLNEISSTIMRGVYDVAGDSGSTGITKTTLSAELGIESNFLYELLFAIVRPFVRAILSPQVMLLFCINLDVMGLVNLKDLSRGDMDAVADFIFRKLAGIIKKLVIQIKNAIVLYLFELVKRAIKKLIDEIVVLLLLEQLNDYIRLLNQIMEAIRKGLFSIGKSINGIDEVNYADIIPEAKGPKVT